MVKLSAKPDMETPVGEVKKNTFYAATYDDVRKSLKEQVEYIGGYIKAEPLLPNLNGILSLGSRLESLVLACEQSFAAADPTSLLLVRWWASKLGLQEETVFLSSVELASLGVKEYSREPVR